MALPRNVVREDRRLEKQAEESSTALAELRWHWTLDEDNPKRVSFTEYAREIGRAVQTVRVSAMAFEVRTSNPALTMTDARTQAAMTSDRLASIEAVAVARGLTSEYVRKTRASEARRVREIATEKAEQNGTTIEDEAPAVAAWVVKSEKAAANAKTARVAKTDLRLVEVEGKALRMIRLGIEMLELLRLVEWDDEAVSFIEDSVANIKAVVNLIDMSLAGAADIDWDKELAKITEDVA